MKNGWDPKAYAAEMKKSTSPVSAFFLIDSFEAISKCTQWLNLLEPFNMPGLDDSQYIKNVCDIYNSGKEVINFDHLFTLVWENNEYHGMLRFHFIETGKYKMELLLPGVIAGELVDEFKDGRDGFFCAFMPPQFYD